MTLPIINELVKLTYTDDLGVVTDISILILTENGVYVETKPLDFGKPNNDKYIDAVRIDLQANENPKKLYARVGVQDNLADEIRWSDKLYFDLDSMVLKDLRIEGKFITLRIEDEFPSVSWTISSIEFFGQLLGIGRL